MIFGDLCGPKASYLEVRKNPEKPHPGNLFRPGSNPGPLRDRRACYHLTHIGGPDRIYFVTNAAIDCYQFLHNVGLLARHVPVNFKYTGPSIVQIVSNK